MPTEARLEAESKLQSNDIKALVATTALGMGYDKPDLSFVVHFQSPGSPVAYYQQVGRAGRALDASTGVLLRGLEDDDIQNYFIENAFAAEHLVNDVVHAFDQAVEQTGGPISLARLQSILNIRVGRLELVAKQLDVDGIVERVGPTTYQRTPQPWEYPATRIDQVTNARRAEQQAMLDYFHSTGCRMRYVAELLDDPAPADCGMCDNCVGPSMERELPVELVAEAEQFLRRRPLTVDPRLQGVPKGERTEQGRALAVWGDGGWGRLVRQGRQTDGVFAAELLDAAAELVADWGPEPAPEWVTCVPSFRQPELVPRFAEQLAARLGLPFVAAVGKREERAPQREQQNSAHQRQNIEGAFEVVAAHPTGPVLLVDDLVDSRWTLTDIGRALRRDGVELVHPLVLASATGRS
jgi:ATP-dependent DNA helicase RecQ